MGVFDYFKQKGKKVKGYIDGATTGVNFVTRVVNAALDDGSGNNIYQKLVINLSGINKGDNLLSLNTLSRLRSEVKVLNISKKFDSIISEIVEQNVKSKQLGLIDKISHKKSLKAELLKQVESTKNAWKSTQPILSNSLDKLYNQSKKISDLINKSNELEATIFKRKDDITKLLNWAIAGNNKIRHSDANKIVQDNVNKLSEQIEKINNVINIEYIKINKLYKNILEEIESKLKEVVKTKNEVANKQIKDIENSIDKYSPINLEEFENFSSLQDCINNLPENLKKAGNENINQISNFVAEHINPKLTKSKKQAIDEQNVKNLTLEWFKSRKTPLAIENNVSKIGFFYNDKDRKLLIEIEDDFKYFFELLDKHNENLKQKHDEKVVELNRLINLKDKKENISDKDLLNLPTNTQEQIYARIKHYNVKNEDYNKAKRWLESNKEIISKIKISDTSYSTESILLFKWFPKDWKKDSQWKDSKLYKSFKEIENLSKQIEDEKKKKSKIPDWNTKQFDLKNDAELFNCIKSLDKFVPLFKNKTKNIDKIIDTIYDEISKSLLGICKFFNTSTQMITSQHTESLGVNKADECPFGTNVNLYKFMKYLEIKAQEIVKDKIKIKIKDSLCQLNKTDDWMKLDEITKLWERFTDIKHGKIPLIKDN